MFYSSSEFTFNILVSCVMVNMESNKCKTTLTYRQSSKSPAGFAEWKNSSFVVQFLLVSGIYSYESKNETWILRIQKQKTTELLKWIKEILLYQKKVILRLNSDATVPSTDNPTESGSTERQGHVHGVKGLNEMQGSQLICWMMAWKIANKGKAEQDVVQFVWWPGNFDSFVFWLLFCCCKNWCGKVCWTASEHNSWNSVELCWK